MIHLNGHKLCVIDTETFGLDHTKHDIREIAVVPLNFDMQPDDTINPFVIEMAPSRLEDIDYSFFSREKIQRSIDTGFNPHVGLDLFIEWLDRLQLPIGKRVMPLAQNWSFDKLFIEDWMGPASYNLYFDGRARDLLPVSLFINDANDAHYEPCLFPKNKLGYICAQIGVEFDQDLAHTALYDAIKTAEAYRKICHATKCLL